MTTTRRTLLERVRDPADREAWEQFFELYAPLLEGYARARGLARTDAQEVRDQCLEVLVRRLPTFEYERARGRFQAWLHEIARGEVVDHLRRARGVRHETAELTALPDPEAAPDEHWERHWRAEHLRYGLRIALEEEAADARRAFELLLLDELSVPDACALTGLNANQVYKAKARILRRVRAALEHLGLEDQA